MSLASHGEVSCVDLDPVAIHFVTCNLAAIGKRVNANNSDVTQFEISADSLIHIDPSRRNLNLSNINKRTIRLEQCSPGLPFIEKLVNQYSSGIKLAPATEVPDSIAANCEREWIGHAGECKQQVLWSGDLSTQHGANTITILDQSKNLNSLTFASEPSSQLFFSMSPSSFQPKRFVYQPHSTIFASGLLNELAQHLGVLRLESQPRLFTSDNLIESAFVSTFEVLATSTTKPKQLSVDLASLHAGQVEFKCRPPFDQLPNVKNKLRLDGDQRITIFPVRIEGKTHVLLCKRCHARTVLET